MESIFSRLSFFAVLLLLSFVETAAQTDSTGRFKVMAPDTNAQAQKPANPRKPPANIIRVDPILYLRGDIPVFYERRLGRLISAEVGLGITVKDFWRDYGEQTTQGMGRKINTPYRLMVDYYPGFSVRVGVKRFVDADVNIKNAAALNGVYVGAYLFYRQHKWRELIDTDCSQQYFDEHQNAAGIQFMAGIQQTSNILIGYNFYGGLGMRYIIESKYHSDSVYDCPKPTHNHYWLPSLLFGLQLGFGW